MKDWDHQCNLYSLHYDISVSVIPLNPFSITKSSRLVLDLIFPDFFIALDTIDHSTFCLRYLSPLILRTVFSPVFLPMFLIVHSSPSSWPPFFFFSCSFSFGFPSYVSWESPQRVHKQHFFLHLLSVKSFEE